MGIVVIGAVFVDIKGYPNYAYIPAGRNVGRIEHVHGGVSRNVAEDIANLELRPVFISLVDYSGTATDVIENLNKHKVNTDYIRRTADGMGTWLAVFDNLGDVVASISKRPDLSPIADILTEHGDEIFRNCDSVILEMDMDKELVKQILSLARKYNKDVYAVVSNMSIAVERRDMLKTTACIVCNQQEAGILFSESVEQLSVEQMQTYLAEKVNAARIPRMVVTMGGQGAVYAELNGPSGYCPAQKVDVKDTTGAGDAFFSGVTVGLTYGKSLARSCEIGTRLAASVIATSENVCPRFFPEEFDLNISKE